MANGIPVRLSASLAATARTTAQLQERSLTEQVEHWARLGQAVENAIAASTQARLKARSHDPDLHERLAVADTEAGRAKAVKLIASRSPVRYGTGKGGALEHVTSRKRRRSR